MLKNRVRCRPSRNIYNAIHTYCADDDIVVILDGDDWFAQKYALSIINQAYEDPNVWLTYGDHRMTNGQGGRPKAIGQEIIDKNEYRKIPWCITHPRSYYAWLYKLIKLEDLQYQGAFIPMAQDFAKMLPMLEMTGGKFKYIPDILYIYYTHSGAHHFRIDPGLQSRLSEMVKNKKPYEPLKKPVIKSAKLYTPFSCSLILVTKLDKEECRKKLEEVMVNMLGISKYYICSAEELLQKVVSHLEITEKEDYCLITTDDIFNHVIDLSSAVTLLRQTEALVVSFGEYTNKRKQELRNTTYFKDGIFTFQLGWKPRLMYNHKEFAHIFLTHQLQDYLTNITNWSDDELCLQTTQDKRFIDRTGLVWIIQ